MPEGGAPALQQGSLAQMSMMAGTNRKLTDIKGKKRGASQTRLGVGVSIEAAVPEDDEVPEEVGLLHCQLQTIVGGNVARELFPHKVGALVVQPKPHLRGLKGYEGRGQEGPPPRRGNRRHRPHLPIRIEAAPCRRQIEKGGGKVPASRSLVDNPACR